MSDGGSCGKGQAFAGFCCVLTQRHLVSLSLYASDAASVPCAKCNVCCGQISNGLAKLMQMLLETQHNGRHDNACLMGIDVDSVIYLSVNENRMELKDLHRFAGTRFQRVREFIGGLRLPEGAFFKSLKHWGLL